MFSSLKDPFYWQGEVEHFSYKGEWAYAYVKRALKKARFHLKLEFWHNKLYTTVNENK